MNRGKIPAESGVTLRHAGCRGLPCGIAVALVLLTACQPQGQNGDERAAAAQRGPVADRQAVGTLDRLTGEYRGTSQGDAFVVWVDALPAVEAGQQAALLIFREQDRLRLETYIKKIIDNPADYYRKVCEGAESTKYGYHLRDFYKVWNTQGGLALLQDGFRGGRLSPDWEEIEGRASPAHLRNEEYIFWREREYAIRRIRRSARTGALASVQLTQTGFIQNFFDNPVISVTRVDNALPTFKLLGSYLDSKFNAQQELGRSGTTLPSDLPDVCKPLMSNDSISHPE